MCPAFALVVLAASALGGCTVETRPVAVTSAEVVTTDDDYEPAYYDGYVVYYDAGRPYYYDRGAVVWVSPGSPYYGGLVEHYRVYGRAMAGGMATTASLPHVPPRAGLPLLPRAARASPSLGAV